MSRTSFWLLNRARIAAGVGVLLIAAGGAPPIIVLAFGAAAVAGPVIRAGLRALSVAGHSAAPRPDEVMLGTTPSGSALLLPRAALGAHTVVLGASGSGKSTTLLTVLSQQIAGGMPVVVIDLKGSPTFAHALARAAHASGRELRLWTLDGGAHWNPLSAGNATELKDKLIATERFTEPHYQRAAERYVQLAIRTLHATAGTEEISLRSVVAALDPERLRALAARLDSGAGEYLDEYLSGLTRDQHSAIRGLASRLAILTESHVGPLLEPNPDAPMIDLRTTLAPGPDQSPGAVVVFSLNSSSYGQLAAQIGTLVVQDLVSATGARQSSRGGARQASVAIDEFSALESENVVSLLARGREAGVGVILATQELADLRRAGPGVADQLLGSSAVKLIHRQDVPASAELAARMSGTRWELETSHRHNRGHRFGARSQSEIVRRATADSVHARRVERHRVDADEIMSLPTGRALALVKSPTARAELVTVAQRPAGPVPRSGRTVAPARQPPAPGVTR